MFINKRDCICYIFYKSKQQFGLFHFYVELKACWIFTYWWEVYMLKGIYRPKRLLVDLFACQKLFLHKSDHPLTDVLISNSNVLIMSYIPYDNGNDIDLDFTSIWRENCVIDIESNSHHRSLLFAMCLSARKNYWFMLFPDGTKSLSEPILTYHQRHTLVFILR